MTAGGTPLRVTKLDLSERGLVGAITGWLGELTELTELRLDGNRLNETIPSKLSRLTKLTHLYLAGNTFQECVPGSLGAVPDNDLLLLGLPDCPAPTDLETDLGWSRYGRYYIVPAGTYTIRLHDSHPPLIFDLPRGWWYEVRKHEPIVVVEFSPEYRPRSIFDMGKEGIAVQVIWEPDFRLFLESWSGAELERGRYPNEYGYPEYGFYSHAETFIDRVTASIWLDVAAGTGN